MDDDLDELTTRAINAGPWEPPPGMVKRKCWRCRYFYAAVQHSAEPICPDCASVGTRPERAK